MQELGDWFEVRNWIQKKGREITFFRIEKNWNIIFRMTEFKNLKGVNTLLAFRDLLKRKILRVFNYLQTGENWTKSLFQVEIERIRAWSKEIETLSSKIYDACVKADRFNKKWLFRRWRSGVKLPTWSQP